MLEGKFCKNLAGLNPVKLEETALTKSVDEKRAREMTGSERLSCHLLTGCRTAVSVHMPQKQPGYIDLLEKNS